VVRETATGTQRSQLGPILPTGKTPYLHRGPLPQRRGWADRRPWTINNPLGNALQFGAVPIPSPQQIPASCRALVFPKLPLDLDVAEVEGGVVYRVEQAGGEGPVLAVSMQPGGDIGGEVGVRQLGEQRV
jgi:hypothetical protein